MVSCGWSCFEIDSFSGLPCNKSDEMKEVRNCDGTKEEIIIAGWAFDRCPIQWLAIHQGEKELFDLWLSCTGGVYSQLIAGFDRAVYTTVPFIHLPYPGSILDQPDRTLSAFKIISSESVRVANDSVKK